MPRSCAGWKSTCKEKKSLKHCNLSTIPKRAREDRPHYRTTLKEAGLTLSTSPDGRLVETVELTEQPFHVPYHPEFKSRPNKPHPLFAGFAKASLEGRK